MHKIISKVIKEPLTHFLILGALLYLTATIFNENESQEQEIVVSAGKIKQLTTLYTKTWQRSPTPEQLANVVQEYILEQAAYYEGVALGLDKNDIVITRRVRQKIDFIAEENNTMPEISDELLTAYLQNNPEKFQQESRLSLKQIYLDPKNYQGNIQLAANNLLQQLQIAPAQDISKLGDRYLFSPYYSQRPLSLLKSTFGQHFSQAADQLTVGTWHGPITSSYGIHLLYIDEKKLGELPSLDQIRTQVVREWENSLRQQSVKEYYQALLKRYPVTIQWPDKYAAAANKLIMSSI